jgi:imidazole glycerol-phosphate synthase subunit HisH
MIGVIDYEAGNLASVTNALRSIDAGVVVSSDARELGRCSGIILPGVGAAPLAMDSLIRHDLAGFIRALEVPFLGICLGMQVLYDASREGNTTCLGIVSGTVEEFDARASRVPHMGWNEVAFTADEATAPMLSGDAHFYFAHSYYSPIGPETSATTECGVSFSAAIRKDNYYGVQFHPEKSGPAGLELLKNFCGLCE